MNINHLEMFCSVVDEGSISQAARIKYVSQPAVTNQIRQLENHYGTDLFNRSEGRLLLTEAGRKLYPFAKEMVDHLQRSEEAVKSIRKEYESTLHIGASLTIGEYFLPRTLGAFQRTYNVGQMSVSIGSTPDIVTKLTDLEIDLALVEGVVENQECTTFKYGEDELILVVPSNHRWAKQEEIELEEMTEERMIWREENAGIRKIIEKELSKHRVSMNRTNQVELGSTQAIKSAVESGLGFSILPKLSVERELELGVLTRIPIAHVELTRDLFIVKKRTRFPKQTVNEFIAFLTKDK